MYIYILQTFAAIKLLYYTNRFDPVITIFRRISFSLSSDNVQLLGLQS